MRTHWCLFHLSLWLKPLLLVDCRNIHKNIFTVDCIWDMNLIPNLIQFCPNPNMWNIALCNFSKFIYLFCSHSLRPTACLGIPWGQACCHVTSVCLASGQGAVLPSPARCQTARVHPWFWQLFSLDTEAPIYF